MLQAQADGDRPLRRCGLGRAGEHGTGKDGETGEGELSPLAAPTRHSFAFLTHRTGTGLTCHTGPHGMGPQDVDEAI